MAGNPTPVKTEMDARPADRPGWTFYYDGDCGFCTRTVRVLSALDRRHRVRWLAFQSLQELPAGLTVEDLQREAYIARGGRMEAGFYSFRRLTALLPPLWPLAPLMWCPGVNLIGERAYAWVARNRSRLPGSVCSIPE